MNSILKRIIVASALLMALGCVGQEALAADPVTGAAQIPSQTQTASTSVTDLTFGAGGAWIEPFGLGFSVKIPVSRGLTLQGVGSAHGDGGTAYCTVIGRALFDLGTKDNIQRYWAAGVGVNSRDNTSAGLASIGAEFLGVIKYGAPSVELGLYSGNRGGNSIFGTAVNVGWHYRF